MAHHLGMSTSEDKYPTPDLMALDDGRVVYRDDAVILTRYGHTFYAYNAQDSVQVSRKILFDFVGEVRDTIVPVCMLIIVVVSY
jgi:hypothetical protein